MTNRQFVLKKFPKAYLDYVVIAGINYLGATGYRYSIEPQNTYYKIREERPFGKTIAKGKTAYMAWRNAKRKIKKFEL